MKIEIFADSDAAARAGALFIANEARSAVAERGKFLLAVSGGKNPWAMLKLLASEVLPWERIHIFQIDERIAPAGDPDRNLTHLLESLKTASIALENIHSMPVNGIDPIEGAKSYEETLIRICGIPPILDLAHLGLGPDGHTASLVPNDPVLTVGERDVAITGIYQDRCRMTLIYPMINRSRKILWLATGAEKAPMIARLKDADPSIPAGRISQENALLFADEAALGV